MIPAINTQGWTAHQVEKLLTLIEADLQLEAQKVQQEDDRIKLKARELDIEKDKLGRDDASIALKKAELALEEKKFESKKPKEAKTE